MQFLLMEASLVFPLHYRPTNIHKITNIHTQPTDNNVKPTILYGCIIISTRDLENSPEMVPLALHGPEAFMSAADNTVQARERSSST